MKILFLNIFEGCLEVARFNRIINFVKAQNLDLVGLSELNEWSADNFSKVKEFKKRIAMPFVSFCKTSSGFDLAIFSKYKLQNEKLITDNFHHGAIKVEIPEKNITLIVTHLSYKNEDERLQEVEILKPFFKERTILIGDLNSLSPIDSYNEEEIIPEMKKRQNTKFGVDKLRREVISELMKQRLVDGVKKFSKNFEYSTPTPSAPEKEKFIHFIPLRMDYIFVSKDLEKKLIKAGIIRNSETDNLSDHYPVVAELDL